jgi:diadenosine tetraphosphate (Ap4A) HIT family hydrolase
MFELHPNLQRDCIHVGDLPLCRVLLMNDTHYPWLILVPRRDHLRELHELNAEEQLQFLAESNTTAELLQSQFGAEKLNIAALGNMVPQLHIHHIARFSKDAAWPGPVWGVHPATPYDDAGAERLLGILRDYYHGSALDFEPAHSA